MVFTYKREKLLFFLFTVSFFCSFSQSIEGEYGFTKDNAHVSSQYFLSLNEDGTFVFKNYWKSISEVSSAGEEFGKGKWSYTDGVITFLSDPDSDINQDYRLNMNNTKAEITRTDHHGIMEQSLKFVESKIFWLIGLELFKE